MTTEWVLESLLRQLCVIGLAIERVHDNAVIRLATGDAEAFRIHSAVRDANEHIQRAGGCLGDALTYVKIEKEETDAA